MDFRSTILILKVAFSQGVDLDSTNYKFFHKYEGVPTSPGVNIFTRGPYNCSSIRLFAPSWLPISIPDELTLLEQGCVKMC